MIRTFRHRRLERFYTRDEYGGILAQHSARIERLLDRLEGCSKPGDMDLPGFKFHALKGERKGTYAVSVSGNWRLTFRFDGPDAVDVDLEDYH